MYPPESRSNEARMRAFLQVDQRAARMRLHDAGYVLSDLERMASEWLIWRAHLGLNIDASGPSHE